MAVSRPSTRARLPIATDINDEFIASIRDDRKMRRTLAAGIFRSALDPMGLSTWMEPETVPLSLVCTASMAVQLVPPLVERNTPDSSPSV